MMLQESAIKSLQKELKGARSPTNGETKRCNWWYENGLTKKIQMKNKSRFDKIEIKRKNNYDLLLLYGLVDMNE